MGKALIGKYLPLYFVGSLGARVFISPPESRRLGWLIRTGDDFPNFVKEIFDNWGTLLLESRVKGQLSTRGELIYEDSTFGRMASLRKPYLNL